MRMKNGNKQKRNRMVVGGFCVIVAIILIVLLGISNPENEIRNATEETANGTISEATVIEESVSDNNAELPIFYVQNEDTLQIDESFSIEQYYITERHVATNYFYIDENGILWGSGSNEYGQLGTGSYGESEYYEEPVKIAEQVVSMDASWNGYFCIYLTEAGELYGVGLNYAGILLGAGSEEVVYSASDYQKVVEPVLLMVNVTYARAGRECIVALTEDKTAYWWGQYAPLTHTSANMDNTQYWSLENNSSNPMKMYAAEPMLIMANCRYITTGTFTGAAINESGELYTWGLNIFGECGTEVTSDDFVRQPVKVMENVRMVWVDSISFSDNFREYSDFARQEFSYLYNTFVLMEDNSLLAAGEGLGVKKKITEVNGDLITTEVHLYSDSFVPICVMEYSEERNRDILNQLSFGMTKEETEIVLMEGNLEYFFVQEENGSYFCVEDSRYYCYFDEQGCLDSLLIQEGGSRDHRFAIGMELPELDLAVEAVGGVLEKIEEGVLERYIYNDDTQQIQYEFYIYENAISVLWEREL